MPHPHKKRHLLNLARSAIDALELDDDQDTYMVGSYCRPFGNSYPHSRNDILFRAGVIADANEEITDEQMEYAEELWEALGEFIRTKCKLVSAD